MTSSVVQDGKLMILVQKKRHHILHSIKKLSFLPRFSLSYHEKSKCAAKTAGAFGALSGFCRLTKEV